MITIVASYNKSSYVNELRKYKGFGKPLVVLEFGCCTYKGAEDKGAMGWAIVDWKKDPPELKEKYIRDEEIQSKNILELLDIFENEKILGAFVFTFITYNYTYNDNPKYDLDMASYGIVKSMPYDIKNYFKSLPWLPKKYFLNWENIIPVQLTPNIPRRCQIIIIIKYKNQ